MLEGVGEGLLRHPVGARHHGGGHRKLLAVGLRRRRYACHVVELAGLVLHHAEDALRAFKIGLEVGYIVQYIQEHLLGKSHRTGQPLRKVSYTQVSS